MIDGWTTNWQRAPQGGPEETPNAEQDSPPQVTAEASWQPGFCLGNRVYEGKTWFPRQKPG
jgi:hypothetical protein